MKRIILVDDDPTTNYLNKLIIEKTGLVDDVVAFESAEQAIDHLLSNGNGEVDGLVLLDLNMPIMNGWQFLDKYEQIKPEAKTKIVILTSSINPSDKQMAEDRSLVVDYKAKPLSSDMLNELINSHL